jgi:hypothetical protein
MRIADNTPLPVLSRLGRASLVAAPAVLCLVPLAIGLLEVQSARAQQASAQYGELLQCVDPAVLEGLVFRTVAATVSDEVPPEMTGVTPPAGFDWIGSQRRAMPGTSSLLRSGSGPVSQVNAAYKTGLSRDEALAAAMAALAADGWTASPQRMGGGAPFGSITPDQPEIVCKDEQAVTVNVNEIDGTTYVSYGFTTGQVASNCLSDDERRRLGMPGAEYMPTLDIPPDPATGRPARRGGAGGSGTTQRVEVFHGASLAELTAALTQQLVEQGWANDASWTGTTTAGSSWSRRVDDDTRVQGTLDLTDTGETSYTIMFRLVALQ